MVWNLNNVTDELHTVGYPADDPDAKKEYDKAAEDFNNED